MNIDDVLNNLNPDIIARFQTAIELGKWPDGRKLTDEQLHTCMQAVIAYEYKHLPEEDRTGYVPPKPEKKPSADIQTLNFKNDNQDKK